MLDCSDYELKGNYTPGVKQICIGGRSVEVYCDNDGWTVFQSRGQFGNPIDYFYRNWTEYENGFGEPGELKYMIK